MNSKAKPAAQNGFTMVEILVVVVIIGILAAIAIPNFVRQRQKGCDTSAMSDIKNAYSAAQVYFSSHPDATVDLAKLRSGGFDPSAGVDLQVLAGAQAALRLTASHRSGSVVYTVDADGRIQH